MAETEPSIPNTTVPTINHLPVEVLRGILVLGDSYRESLLLVCRLWRDIVYSSPELWTMISITSDMDDRDIEDILSIIARAASLPVQVELNTLDMKMSLNDLHRIFEAIPFERWETLDLGKLRPDILIPEDACFKGLKYLGISIDYFEHWQNDYCNWKTLLARIAATSQDLDTLQANEHGLAGLMWTRGDHLHPIVGRVSTAKYQCLPHCESPPAVLPPNISRLHIDYISTKYWDISHVTHLEIQLFRLGATLVGARPPPQVEPCFPNVEYLYISRIRADIKTGRIHFPKLRTLRYDVRGLDQLAFFIAPALETIVFPKEMTSVPPPMGTLHAEPPTIDNWMQPTTLRFEGGIRVDHLLNALMWFPKVKHLTAEIKPTLPTKVVQENTWTFMEQAFLEELEDEEEETEAEAEVDIEATSSRFKHARDLVTAQFTLTLDWNNNPEAFKIWDHFVNLMATVRQGTSLKTVGFRMKEGRGERTVDV